MSEQKINLHIKDACKEIKINSPVEVVTYKGGKKEYEKFFKYELITTHVAVKTFITHCAEKGITPKVVAEITGKTVQVILNNYYGTNDKVIEMEMQKAFGLPETKLLVAV
jgi:integrase